jgi:hypothetical protein
MLLQTTPRHLQAPCFLLPPPASFLLTPASLPRPPYPGLYSFTSELLTNAMRLLSGDHEGVLIDPCPP